MRGKWCNRSRNRYNGLVEPVEQSQLPVEPQIAYERRNTYLELFLWHFLRHGVSHTCGARSERLFRPYVLLLSLRASGFATTRDGPAIGQ